MNAAHVARLTAREREVLGLLIEGLTAKEIGGLLGLSHWTVRAHLANARKRTGSRTTEQLASRFVGQRASHRRARIVLGAPSNLSN